MILYYNTILFLFYDIYKSLQRVVTTKYKVISRVETLDRDSRVRTDEKTNV